MTDPDSTQEQQRQQALNNARGFLGESMSDLWWTFLVRGILGAMLGFAALFWPTASVAILLRIVGAFLVFDGAIALFGYRNRQGSTSENLPGIVSVIIGLVLLLLPGTSARVVFVLLGILALFRGCAYLYTWWHMPDGDFERTTLRNSAIVTLLLGLVLIIWPATGLVTIAWLLAIAAFVFAAVMLFLAFRVKRLRDRVQMKADGPSN